MKPKNIFIEITPQCVLRCRQCHIWKNKKPKFEISTKDKINILNDAKNWIGKPRISFTGGEPYMKKRELLELSSFCNKNKLRCSTNSNGYLINEEMAIETAKTNLQVYISLDSMDPKIHNEIRGREDSQQKALEAIDHLIKYCGSSRIKISSLLMKKNLSDAISIIKLAKKKEIDILFQPIMCDWTDSTERVKSEYFPSNRKEIEKSINDIYNASKIMGNVSVSKKKLSLYKNYFLTGKAGIKKCNFGGNLVIDHKGDVRLCFSSAPIGNILNNDIKTIWNSERAKLMRENLKSCNKNCSLLLCNNSLLSILGNIITKMKIKTGVFYGKKII